MWAYPLGTVWDVKTAGNVEPLSKGPADDYVSFKSWCATQLVYKVKMTK